jgi:hypothetical protein
VASQAIKAHDPALKVGGYAAANPVGELVPQFLAFCVQHELPLDFFSWHQYCADPADIITSARTVRTHLDSAGFIQTESHLDEWNLWDADWGCIYRPGEERNKRAMFERQKGEEGASFVAAVFTRLQDAPVDLAAYYDGQPLALFCGLFDYYGVPQKTYYAFPRRTMAISSRISSSGRYLFFTTMFSINVSNKWTRVRTTAISMDKTPIKYEYLSFAPYIKNRDKTGMCPIENLSLKAKDVSALQESIKIFLESIKR